MEEQAQEALVWLEEVTSNMQIAMLSTTPVIDLVVRLKSTQWRLIRHAAVGLDLLQARMVAAV